MIQAQVIAVNKTIQLLQPWWTPL